VLLAGQRATSLALVFSELLGNALEHGGKHVKVTVRAEDAEVVLEVVDDGPGFPPEPRQGTGLSIVRALVRDELRGTLEFGGETGTRAEVRFPA
jgi:two-component sensor histidine kinase